MKKVFDKCLVPVLTVVVFAACVFGLYKLTQKVGENLAPVKPRVIIFGATYCGYCPTPAEVQKFAHDFPNANVEHYNVDEGGKGAALAKKYHVRRTPTIIVCDDKGCQVFFSMPDVRSWLGTHSLLVEGK